jgi:hypothetical protein
VTQDRIPGWAQFVAIVVAVLTVLLLVPAVALVAVTVAATVGQIQRTISVDVGPAPRLRVDAQFASLAIEAGPVGRIVVEDRRAAGSITRAGAAAALAHMAVAVSQQRDQVLVRQPGPAFEGPTINRNSTITIQVPMRTDVTVANVGDVRIQGIEGAVSFQGPGSIELRDVTLRGTSTLDAPLGDVTMTNVTVAGTARVTKTLGVVTFNGQLAPGGSRLDIADNAGDVTVTLPQPTDAHADITASPNDFHANGPWLFTPDAIATPRHWTADLGPNPTGTVTVHSYVGEVSFFSR